MFSIYGTRLQDLEAKVAQIKLNVLGGFWFLSLSVVLQTSYYLGYLQTLLYYPF